MNSRTLNVHYLPRHVAEEDLAGSVVVVVDLLRASTTICQALASGASEVVPFLEIEDALTAADRAGRDNVVLGGERQGGKIPGFDLGNSPSEYTPEAVGGKPVYMTTTNGTRALQHARLAKRVLIGAAVNLAALAGSLQDEPRVDILCAGTDGQETREDILAAGGLVTELLWLRTIQTPNKDDAISQWDGLSDSAIAAGTQWSQTVLRANDAGRSSKVEFAAQLRETQGGRNLLEIGFEQDLIDCAQINRLNVIPELDVPSWRIRLV
jgi:2-phosphosulfolactate phosphatase